MKLAIIGSRDHPVEDRVRLLVRLVAKYFPGTTVISGGAKGVDTWAVGEAQSLGLPVEVYPPSPKPGQSYVDAIWARNHLIIQACTHLVAFWDGQSRGTKGTYEIARQLGKPVWIFRIPQEKT